MLFDERNLADVVYKLNGQAEVFYRKSSIKYDKPTHPAKLPVENKNKDNKKKEERCQKVGQEKQRSSEQIWGQGQKEVIQRQSLRPAQ